MKNREDIKLKLRKISYINQHNGELIKCMAHFRASLVTYFRAALMSVSNLNHGHRR